jgi:hypothetical protein
VKWGQASLLLLAFVASASAGDTAQPLFTDDFEHHAAGQLPGAPWKEETYESGSVIKIDIGHAFSGIQAMHVLNPGGTDKRRGYVAIHLGGPLAAAAAGHVRPCHGLDGRGAARVAARAMDAAAG